MLGKDHMCCMDRKLVDSNVFEVELQRDVVADVKRSVARERGLLYGSRKHR